LEGVKKIFNNHLIDAKGLRPQSGVTSDRRGQANASIDGGDIMGTSPES
jgi:hypothetical protein